jgi:hypothetical protein
MRIQVFWNVFALSGRAVPDGSEDCSTLSFRVKQSRFYLDCLTQKIKAIFSFRTPGNTHPVTQCHNPKDLAPQQHPCKCQASNYDAWWGTMTYEYTFQMGGGYGNLYWILMRKGLEMKQPGWLRNKYENNIPMKLSKRECRDMKWTSVAQLTPILDWLLLTLWFHCHSLMCWLLCRSTENHIWL